MKEQGNEWIELKLQGCLSFIGLNEIVYINYLSFIDLRTTNEEEENIEKVFKKSTQTWKILKMLEKNSKVS